MSDQQLVLPALPLRDVVVFPNMVLPLFVGREESIKGLEQALAADKKIFLVAQHNSKTEQPKQKDLLEYGVVATVLQSLKLADNTIKILVEGVSRARLVKFSKSRKGFYSAQIESVAADVKTGKTEHDALMRHILDQFEIYIKNNKKIPPEIIVTIGAIKDPEQFADNIASHLNNSVADRHKLLSESCITKRLELLSIYLSAELDMLEVDRRVQDRLKEQVNASQRQYYLNEKIKAIQQELGELDEGSSIDEIETLTKQVEEAGMSEEAKKKALSEIGKLKMMPAMSAEATVSRNYLEWLINYPWQKTSAVSKDIIKAEEVLDADHYGLEKVKERILEYLAVGQRVEKLKGPILCLVGPPGVGKTSLGQSIANATGRKFVRVALGGVRDEAEVRGHRRTYIGAMPGKVVQKLCKVGVKNPLFMLDEVDKMAMDFRGDPASALLEVLDPEQNDTFNDHFLEVDCDLSDVMFVATSNSMDIPPALLDRMEIIRLSGYTETEKLNIAKSYLIPRQIEQNGLKTKELTINDLAIIDIIRYYTREAGVRNLERDIAKICRKVVRELLTAKTKRGKKVTKRNLEKYLGVQKYIYGLAEEKDRIGQVTGLAWTEVGGELLTIEAQLMPGKDGQVTRTGSLGEVMLESITAAMTVVRSRCTSFGIDPAAFQEHDFHIHVPEGATPKDGPSAGIGMCTALVSVLTNNPVRADVAMTGEITLRGEVLPIGGLKEKLLAALGGGIKTVIIPRENKRDLKELPEEVLENLEIYPVKWIDEVLNLALQKPLQEFKPKKDKEVADIAAALKKKTKKKKTSSSRTRAH